jgi:peptide/nickel transport system permease protein
MSMSDSTTTAAFDRSWLSRLPVSARVGGLILLAMVIVAATGHLWAPYAPGRIMSGRPFEAPSFAHILGTDNLGRDVFSRVVIGSRPVMLMAISAAAIATLFGSAIALILSLYRGMVDEIGMRILEVLASIPPIVLALLLISALGNSSTLIVLTVAFLFVPRIARVVRAGALAVVREDFVTAAITRGESMASIAAREVLPNVLGTVMVEFAIRCGFAIVFIGALGFLGFGAPPPAPEWGLMINEGRAHITASYWPVVAPAGAMAVLVIAVSLFTDGLARMVGETGVPMRAS